LGHTFSFHIDDLIPPDTTNATVKFAGDSTLLVPEACDIPVEQEIWHIHDWASLNKFSLNLNKTKEIVFNRPNDSFEIIPSADFGVRRFQFTKLRGVYFDTKLSFAHHVDFLIRTCRL